MVFPSDKCGVLTLVQSHDFHAMLQSKMPDHTYSCIPRSDVSFKYISTCMRKHTKMISEHVQGSEIVPFVNRWWNASSADGLFCPLNFTIKTHKPPGNVSLRVAHNGSRSPLGGLLHVVRLLLFRRVRQLKHIAHSTTEVTNQLAGLTVSPTDRLITGDVGDFFMVETHARLLHGLSLDPEVCFLVPCVRFLLEEQFVT
jgi:hypothetical protein